MGNPRAVNRPIVLGVVGDSAAGKTTITRGLVRALGEEHVTHIAADDYHRYDRRQRAARDITPLHLDCNYLDIMEQDLARVLAGRSILQPVHQHKDGTFGAPVYVTPRQFTVVEGLLGYHTQALRDSFEEAIWDRMHFASHLRSERLGEFTIGTELHRSHSLAIVQVLILYHLVTARAAVALGGESTRVDRDLATLDERETVEL